MKEKMDFPKKLKKLRKEKGLTQEELASAIYVSRTLISKYENGSIYPSKEVGEKLASYFNTEPSELFDTQSDTNNNVSNKINTILSILIITISTLFSVFTIIPCLKVRYYDYSNEQLPPKASYKTFTPIQLTLNNSNPIVVITLVGLLTSIVLSSLSFLFKKCRWIKISNYILFAINVFLMFFSIVFSVAYCSNKVY